MKALAFAVIVVALLYAPIDDTIKAFLGMFLMTLGLVIFID